MQVDRYKIHDIELVVDRLQVTDELKPRLSQSVQQTLKLGKDLMFLLVDLTAANEKKSSISKKQVSSFGGDLGEVLIQYSKLLMCEDTGISYEEPSPNSFSFNSPYGPARFVKDWEQCFMLIWKR